MNKILVDVFCPAISKRFDLLADDRIKGQKLKEIITEQIKSITGYDNLFSYSDDIVLICDSKGCIDPALSISEQDINNGDTIMVV